jgi:hypothetical protein
MSDGEWAVRWVGEWVGEWAVLTVAKLDDFVAAQKAGTTVDKKAEM